MLKPASEQNSHSPAPSVAIIGGGPAGLTAAYVLSKAGRSVEVFEASSAVGGMAKTISLWHQLVDLGPHRFFCDDPRVNRLWLELIGKDYRMVQRLTRIYYKNKFFHYPLKPFNALFGLGFWTSVQCVLSYLLERTKTQVQVQTFEQWVTQRFGKKLFQIFFKSYSEKLWGISCSELDSDFAAQRIKKLSLYEALKNALFPTGNKHKTLVDEFAYPLLGAGEVYERMAKAISRQGSQIHFGVKVEEATPNERGRGFRLKLTNGDERLFEHVISTMPITQLLQGLNSPPEIQKLASTLRFRNTILVYLRISGENPFPDQWIYVHSPDLDTGRITNFSNWVPEIKNNQSEHIVCLEYWCFDNSPNWRQNDAELIEVAKQDLRKSKLVKTSSIIDGHVVRVPKCYPVYDAGYKDRLKPIQEFLSNFEDLSVIGRYGAFKYNNQDHSILMGMLAAENVLGVGSHNLWALNTDYEYQESSRITSTGLVVE